MARLVRGYTNFVTGNISDALGAIYEKTVLPSH